MKKGFTIVELLVAMGLFAAVIAAAGMIFHYSIESQRTAAATAEIMRTLRAITDQININFEGLRKDEYLVLWSSNDSNDALYFFSTGDFQSWPNPSITSNTARIYLGPSQNSPTDLALDIHLLTSGSSGTDYNDVNCPADIIQNEDPCQMLSGYRPTIDINNPDDAWRLFAQHVGSFKIEWTADKSSWTNPSQIEWFGEGNRRNATFENLPTDPYYLAYWSPLNQPLWPKALKFTFTLYDSKKILKGGRTFEHIVYIGN